MRSVVFIADIQDRNMTMVTDEEIHQHRYWRCKYEDGLQQYQQMQIQNLQMQQQTLLPQLQHAQAEVHLYIVIQST